MGKRHWDRQLVWPKDGPKGRGHRGFFGRMENVLTGKGPDIFITKKGSRTAIKPDNWGNWDSYHDPEAYRYELGHGHSGLWDASRGTRRYDPHSRRYKKWVPSTDWHNLGINWPEFRDGHGDYPRFTEREYRKMARTLMRGHRINPARMGRDWDHFGPKRFRPCYDQFWQEAHRAGENLREGFDPQAPINPNFLFHQHRADDLDDWMFDQGLPQFDRAWRHYPRSPLIPTPSRW